MVTIKSVSYNLQDSKRLKLAKMLVKFLGTQYCLYTNQKILSLKLKGKLQITLVLTLTTLTLRELCNNSRA